LRKPFFEQWYLCCFLVGWRRGSILD